MLIESVRRMMAQAHSNKHPICLNEENAKIATRIEVWHRKQLIFISGRPIYFLWLISWANTIEIKKTAATTTTDKKQFNKKKSYWALTTLGERWSNTSSTSNYNNFIIWNPPKKIRHLFRLLSIWNTNKFMCCMECGVERVPCLCIYNFCIH